MDQNTNIEARKQQLKQLVNALQKGDQKEVERLTGSEEVIGSPIQQRDAHPFQGMQRAIIASYFGGDKEMIAFITDGGKETPRTWLLAATFDGDKIGNYKIFPQTS